LEKKIAGCRCLEEKVDYEKRGRKNKVNHPKNFAWERKGKRCEGSPILWKQTGGKGVLA